MSFQGRIEDVAVTDVMQLIRLGGHSGTLTIRAGEEEALIGFERGRLVSAWSSRSLRLGELLLAAGVLDDPALQRALDAQESERPRRTIGQVLVRQGATSPDMIRQVVGQEIERVVKEVLAWPVGTFDFALDDLTPLVEVSRFSGAPKVDMDTQQVILEVLQTMEEDSTRAACQPPTPTEVAPEGSEPVEEFVQVLTKGGRKRPDGEASAVPEPTQTDTAITIKNEVPEHPRFQMVSPDAELLAQINHMLAETGDRMTAVGLRDAGASLLGEPPPIVVVDLRYQSHAVETLIALCRARPRASVIALFVGRAPLRELYQAGVLSISSAAPETVAACVSSVARQRRFLSNEHAIAEGVRASFARLRRIIADLRSGLLATSVSVNLLNVVAESLDRGVLLVPDRDQLVALGAFGQTAQGEELAIRTQTLAFPVGGSGVFFECLRDSHTRRVNYDHAGLPQAFYEAVDRPVSGEIVVLPVPGSQRVIAVIYLDNGARDRTVGDLEIFELAAFQLGLALENEFLRRSGPERETAGPVIKMRNTG
ncbi:MAG: DUF4388 domain-containing protein [Polyangia bacterium]